jgi:chitodextrinase
MIAAAIVLLAAPVATAHAADPVIAAAGDIACDNQDAGFNSGNGSATRCRQKYTSNLLVNAGLAKVLTLGDNQYDSSSADELAASYDPSWGRVKSITRPAIGNHEPGSATAYFDYFNGPGANDGPAGPRGKGWYSFDVGNWHLIELNSNCSTVGCTAGSEQEQWLRADLAAHPYACTLAYWHHPRFSSGHDGNNTFMQPIWKALYEGDADLALVGHSHNYERFAPQDVNGNLDRTRGIRQFVVGTGGAFFTGVGSPQPNSEVRQNSTFGVIKITLHPTSYDWQFQPEAGQSFTDSGTESCHGGSSDSQPPTAPSNLTANAPATTRVDLSWNAATDDIGVTGYEVFRDGSLVATTTGTTYSDTTVGAGTSYTYQVKARDLAGNRSPFSNSASVTTPFSDGNTVTVAPVADARVLEASPSTNYGTSYLRADGGADPDVETYLKFDVTGISSAVLGAKLRLYDYNATANGPAVYSTSNDWTESGIFWNIRPAPTSTARDDKGAIALNTWTEYDVTPFVSGNGTYSFLLATTSADGIDWYSREGTDPSLRPQLVLTLQSGGGDLEAPRAPANLTAGAASSTRVDLSWDAATDNVGVTGYEIFRNGSLLASPTGTSYTDTSASPGTTYTYQVKARDAAGNRSDPSNSATVLTPPDLEPPTAPSSLAAAVASANRVDLSWSPATDNLGVTGYDVFRDGSLLTTTTGTTYADITTVAGTTYSYYVKARDAAGNRSGASNSAMVTTPFTFAPVADAYVKESSPNSNFGAATSLIGDGSPRWEVYVKFTVSNVSGIVTGAKLRLHAFNGTSDGPALYTTNSNWTETGTSGINWATRPVTTSGVLGDKSKVAAATWVEYDVTPVVIGNGTYSFLLQMSNSNDIRMYSREAASLRPELTLTVG